MGRGDRKKVRELQQENLKDRRVHNEGGGHSRSYSVQLRKAPVPVIVESGGTALQVEMEKEHPSNA